MGSEKSQGGLKFHLTSEKLGKWDGSSGLLYLISSYPFLGLLIKTGYQLTLEIAFS